MFLILEEVERLGTARVVIQNRLQVINLLKDVPALALVLLNLLHCNLLVHHVILVFV